MSKSTIEVTGLGRVYVATSAASIELAGGVTIEGDPANCRTKKVSADKRHYDAADAAGYSLKEVKMGYFLLKSSEDE